MNIASRFLNRLVAQRAGRAFLFTFMADAEESDEGAFDEMLKRADAPDVAKMVTRHRDDEVRHASWLRACADRAGGSPHALPAELRYIDRIDGLTRGAFRRNFADDAPGAQLMKVYALLQVVEERGVAQFALIAEALRRHDPESAAVVARIVEDERRHVLYASAIVRRYAPDARTAAETLRAFRSLEERAFEAHRRAFSQFVVARGLLAVGPLERVLWRALTLAPPVPRLRRAQKATSAHAGVQPHARAMSA
jgi:rubrerythrin